MDRVRTRAEADMAEGNPRRAREGFRRLARAGDEQALDRFLEATGLHLETLFAGGHARKASPLLKQVRDFEGEKVDRWATPWETRLAIALEEDWSAKASLAREFLQLPTAPETPSVWAIDTVVLGFDPPSAGEADSLASDFQGIHRALLALLGRDREELDQALKAIGRRSPLAEWKWILKGWGRLIEPTDTDQALKCFEQIRGGGLPGKVASLLLTLLNGKPLIEPDQIGALCGWSGDASLAKILPKADAHWRRGELRLAYLTLQRGLDFPGTGADLIGELSNLFIGEQRHSREHYEELGDEFSRRIDHFRFRDNHEAMCLSRWAVPMESEPKAIETRWLTFLEAHEREYGKRPELASLVHERIGRAVLRGLTSKSIGGPAAQLVLRHCEKAEPLAPPRASLYELWIEALERSREKAARDRVLERAIKVFPDNPKLLLAAGSAAVGRKAYVKGSRYLKRLVEIDPANREGRTNLAIGLRATALSALNKGKMALARQRLDEEWQICLAGEIDDSSVGRAYQAIRRAAIERAAEDIGRGDEDTRSQIERWEAVAAQELPPVVFTFTHFFFCQCFQNGRSAEQLRFRRVMKGQTPNIREATILIKFLDANNAAEDKPYFSKVTEFAENYLNQLGKRGELSKEGVRDILRRVEFEETPLELPVPFLKRAHREWPEDPFINLVWIVNGRGSRWDFGQWVDVAEEARDHDAINFARQVEGDAFGMAPVGWDDDDDFDRDPFDFALPQGSPSAGPGGLDDETIEFLKHAPRPVLKQIAKELGLPLEALQALINLSGNLPFNAPGSGGGPKKKQRRKPAKKKAPRKAAPKKKPTQAAPAKVASPKKKPAPKKKAAPDPRDSSPRYRQIELFDED